MEAPHGVSTAFVNETLYEKNLEGYFEINSEHVAELINHGFVHVDLSVKTEKLKKKRDA